MVSTNEFKTGTTILIDNNIFSIEEFQHVKPGKGGAFVVTKLKNLRTGAIVSKTFNAGVKVETAEVTKEKMVYSYDMDDVCVFMNTETYEQLEIQKSILTQQLKYMIPDQEVQIRLYEGEVLDVELPDKVTLTVTDTPLGDKGNSATNTEKEATLETGVKIRVPQFINNGDAIIVNTSTGKYDSRAK